MASIAASTSSAARSRSGSFKESTGPRPGCRARFAIACPSWSLGGSNTTRSFGATTEAAKSSQRRLRDAYSSASSDASACASDWSSQKSLIASPPGRRQSGRSAISGRALSLRNCTSLCKAFEGQSACRPCPGKRWNRVGDQPGAVRAALVSGVHEPPRQAPLADRGGPREGDIGHGRVEMIQEPRDRPADDGMDHRGGNLGRRFQHEPPPRHARMRDHQLRGVDPPLIEKEQIQVQRPRAPPLAAGSRPS